MPPLHPLLEAARVDLVAVESHREQGANERAHAHACNPVDGQARGAEFLEHADVRKCARAAAGEHDADRLTAKPAGGALYVTRVAIGSHDMRLDRLQRGSPAVKLAGSGLDVINEEIAAAQLRAPGQRVWDLSTAGHGNDAVGLL